LISPEREDQLARTEHKTTVAEFKKEMRKEVAAAVNALGPKTSDAIEAYRKNGVCACCNRRPRKGQLCRDHHHKSKTFRGLLCIPCNLALGLIKDDPETAAAMAEYLRKPPVMGDDQMIDFDE